MVDRRIRTLRIGLAVWCWLISLATAPGAAAQTDSSPNLSSLLPELILREIRLPTPTTARAFAFSALQPVRASTELQNPAVAVVDALQQADGVQLSTSPIGSSSGGFSYAFDPDARHVHAARASSFGPLFAERAATDRPRTLSAGFNYQHSSYDRFEGSNPRRRRRSSSTCGTRSAARRGRPRRAAVLRRRPAARRHAPQPVLRGGRDRSGALARRLDRYRRGVRQLRADRSVGRRHRGPVRPRRHGCHGASRRSNGWRPVANPLIHTFQAGSRRADTDVQLERRSASGLGDIALRTKFRLADFAVGRPRGGGRRAPARPATRRTCSAAARR